MAIVRNRDVLLENARSPLDRKARGLTLDAIEAAIRAVDPRRLIHSHVTLGEAQLKISEVTFDLSKLQNVFVVGGGKASGFMAEAIEEILGKYVANGAINILRGTRDRFKTRKIRLLEAGHPVPDEAGVDGVKQILKIVEEASEKDLIICLISGGGSALMPLPREGIALKDKQSITRALMESGATIDELNVVRKHISEFKGGWLAKKAYSATLVGLLISDVVGDPLDVIASGPTVPDHTTFKDAIEALKKYGLWEGVSDPIRKVLLDGLEGRIPETPKADDPAFKKVHNIVIGNNRAACLAALHHFHKAGVHALYLTSYAEGEARHYGTFLAALAKESLVSNNPLPRPVGMVAGGETTVRVVGKGVGGRNQETMLSAALKIEGLDGVAIASLGTDGLDGPTDAAGAVVDGKTLLRAKEKGLVASKFLEENDSYTFFSNLGDLIMTGPTGTNVNDIVMIVVV